MYSLLLKGVLLGLTLSFMIGPLLFAIVQAGIECGFRAGVAVAAGIWMSDILFVLCVQYGVEALQRLSELPHFTVIAGIAGSLVLIAFGLGSLLLSHSEKGLKAPVKNRQRNLWNWWLKGFLLNTINPFTVFFWLGITGAVIVPNHWNTREVWFFFSAMLITLSLTDLVKAYAAKRVGAWLTPAHIRAARKGIGIVLVVFGIVLAVRAFSEG